MKYATGRGTKCKHSTAMEWDEYEKKKRKSRVRYSTGRGTALRHSSGVLLDGEMTEQPEQANQPGDDFLSLEEEKQKETKKKDFKKVVADY